MRKVGKKYLRGHAKGRAEGIEIGIEKGIKEMFFPMYRIKFNEDVSASVRRQVDNISDMEELRQLNMALMMASDVEQFMLEFLK